MKNKKKLEFYVDKVSEDSFYENLLLGLPKILNTIPNIRQKKLRRFPPLNDYEVRSWESFHKLRLPQDLRNFYLSCNGFSYTYVFSYEPTKRDDILSNKMYGKIDVNCLEKLTPIFGYEIKETANIYQENFMYKLDLSKDSKVFSLSNYESYTLVLVYTIPEVVPTIWIYVGNAFFFIANDLTTYLKMAIAHLGVPFWQFVFTPLGLPGRSKEMLNIVAPGIIFEDRQLIQEENCELFNVIDTRIFTLENVEEKSEDDEGIDVAVNAIKVKNETSNCEKLAHLLKIEKRPSSLKSTPLEKTRKFTFCKRPTTPRILWKY